MKTKQEKLKAAYGYLRSLGEIHTQKEFAEKIGFDKTNLSSAFKGSGRYLTDGLFNKICDAYSELNINYFLKDEGEMLKSETSQPAKIESKQRYIRYWTDVDVTGGDVTLFEDATTSNVISIDIPEFQDCTDAVNLYGDSMSPRYKSGQIVILKEWKESFIEFGNVFLLITKKGHKTIKYLRKSANTDEVMCVSENSEYDPFVVKIDDIDRLYIVKGAIEKTVL